MLDITLRQLEAFVAAAEYSSFTRAAEELFLTQSTVSAHIRTLEEELGVRLIVRGARRRPSLTDEGKQAYAAARDILARCQALETLNDGPHGGELTIGASTVPAQYLLPALLSGFSAKHGDTRYLLRRGDSAQIHAQLERGEVRLGFVGMALDRKGCAYQPLLDDRLVLITPPDDRFRALKRDGTEGRALLGEPMIAREETSGTRQAFAQYLRRNRLAQEDLRIIACMDSPEAIKSSVARGMGVAVISALAAREEVAAGRLLAFDLERDGAFRKIYLVWRRSTAMTPTEQRFIAFVRAAAREHVFASIENTDETEENIENRD